MLDQTVTVRIFISSPGDVKEERDQAEQVVEELQREFADAVRLETVWWEALPLSATASFQEGIEVILGQRPIEIAVFILWARLGTRLGPRVLRPDGTAYRSGTEREFDLMLAAYEQSGRQRPHIMVYFREDERWKQRLVCGPKAELREMLEQQELIDGFRFEHFQDREGRNRRAYHTYEEPISFAEHLETHLRQALSTRFAMNVASPLWKGPPYRGLQVFDQEHRKMFHGREAETCELLHRLRELVTRSGNPTSREDFAERWPARAARARSARGTVDRGRHC